MAIATIQVCEYCGKSFLSKDKYDTTRRFCSRTCARRWTVAHTPLPSSLDEMGHLILRVCKDCKLSKPLLSIYFAPHPKGRRGWKHRCKVCHSEQKSIYNKGRRTENNRTHQAWRKTHPGQRRIETTRRYAKHGTKLREAERLRRRRHGVPIRQPRRIKTAEERHVWMQQWEKANPERRKEINARRRARLLGAPQVEKIDREAIYARDRWICQLCFKKVDKKLRWPDPLCATLDHIIPLTKNGDHTHQNLVLVHNLCNTSKRDRTVVQQMRLFG